MHKILLGEIMNDNVVLNPFMISIDLESPITVEKNNPIPFCQIEIDKLKTIIYDSKTSYFKFKEMGDYYINYQFKTDKTYHISLQGNMKYFEADSFPVIHSSHGSGIITVEKPDTFFYFTCVDENIKLMEGKTIVTIFKVK